MPAYDFRSPRLFIDAPLEAGGTVALERAQAHYLSHVLRLKTGDRVLVFNGRDGEWSATLAGGGKRTSLAVGAKTRQQTAAADLHYLFAPLKSARLDYMVQKAVEMGVSRLVPVLTRHGQVAPGQSRAHARQCHRSGRAMRHSGVAGDRRAGGRWRAISPTAIRRGIWCSATKTADAANPVAALGALPPAPCALAVLVGPEGGFAEDERAALLKQPNVVRLVARSAHPARRHRGSRGAGCWCRAVLGDWRERVSGCGPAGRNRRS